MRYAIFGILLAAFVAGAQASGLTEPLVLVARPQLQHPLYARSVIVVAPFGRDQHYGFIVNRPTNLRLADLFPAHAPSRAVSEPVFLGGPVYPGLIFALLEGDARPGPGCTPMMPGLFAVFDGRTVDRVIEQSPRAARYFTGLVVWRPGELSRELAGRLWYVLDAKPGLARRDAQGLWEELVARAQIAGDLHVTRAVADPGR